MKTFIQTFTGSIASGFASYYLVFACFNALLWLFDYELTTSQRIFVIENGYLAFVAGMVVGTVVFWRVFRKVG
jgi:hypothetical protein|tara:strand:+ start:584 stop:802 length:219 start_codon:yes stop_codon:yes gene_type:complete